MQDVRSGVEVRRSRNLGWNKNSLLTGSLLSLPSKEIKALTTKTFLSLSLSLQPSSSSLSLIHRRRRRRRMWVFYLLSLPLTMGMVVMTLKYFAGPHVPTYVLFTVGYTWFCSLSLIILVPADIWTVIFIFHLQLFDFFFKDFW